MDSFVFQVGSGAEADLLARLQRWREVPMSSGARPLGIDPRYLAAVLDHWADQYRLTEFAERINAYPQFTTRLGEHVIHFVHVRGEGEHPYPLVLTHGWPSSFLEFLPLIGRLTTPSKFGGTEADAFDVVIPSIPGFGFSTGPVVSYTEVANLWVELMGQVLGYERFGAHGGDIGAGITNRMGLYHAGAVDAIHVLSAPVFDIRRYEQLSDEEVAFADYGDWWAEAEGAYAHQQRTKPHTLGVALNDSPAGLAAWILEKWIDWSDLGASIETQIGREFLLDNVTLYWLSQSITSSMEMYWHDRNRPTAAWPDAKVSVPTKLLLTTEKVDRIPLATARRIYENLDYEPLERGGHFLAAERPELLATNMQDFFRRLR